MTTPLLHPSAPAAVPDLLLIGAAKSGTTTLYHALAGHPGVCMSAVKEPNHFAFAPHAPRFRGPGDDARINARSVVDARAYAALFAACVPGQLRGEASHWYLYHPDAAARIRAAAPAVRLIAVLRNPADRAYADYRHMRRTGRETLATFEEALAAEAHRIEAGWAWGHYLRRGRYAEQLQRYLSCFPREQLLVVFYDDLAADAPATLARIYRHLGVDDAFEPDLTVRYNRSGEPRMAWLESMLARPGPLKAALRRLLPHAAYRWKARLQAANLRREPMAEATRSDILARFEDDVDWLEKTFGRDLSAWRPSR